MGLAFGGEIEGATLDKETNILTFDGFDPSQFAGEFSTSYTSISGTVTGDDDGMMVDLTLEGGVVKSIEFTILNDQALSDTGFTNSVKINGTEMEIEISPEDMG